MTPIAQRYESFHVYRNLDGTWHILYISGGGGAIFADNIQGRDEAEWTVRLLNTAIAAKK